MPLSTVAQNAAADALTALLNVGSTNAPRMVYGDSGFTNTLVIDLDSPDAFGDAAAGISTASNPPFSATAAATFTATNRRFLDRDGAIVEGSAVQDAIVDAVTALIDAGAGTATLEYGDSTFATIYATANLNSTPFAAASGGTANANGLPLTAVGAVTGTATHYRFKDKDGTVVDSQPLPVSRAFVSGQNKPINQLSYTTTAYSQILTSSVSITSGEDYSEAALTYTQPDS